MTVDEIITQREQTHGRFETTADIAQATKRIWHMHLGWEKLSDVQCEALDCIATKVARILSGNCNDTEHWTDISGYAQLGICPTSARRHETA